MQPPEELAHLQRSLAAHGLDVYSVRKMLSAGGNYLPPPPAPRDHHPSAKAFPARIATYIARKILCEKER